MLRRCSIISILIIATAPAIFTETTWDIDTLDTAREVSFLSDVEKDVILELNKVRTDPGLYAETYLVPRRVNYNGRYYERPGAIRLLTREGIRALDECIAELRRTVPVGVLGTKRGLSRSAADHATDQSRTGGTGHTGSDRSSMAERIASDYFSRQGLVIDPEDILITGGSQHGLDLIAKTLLNEGDRLIMEAPSYLGAIQAFSIYRPEFLTVPVTDEGMDTTQLGNLMNEHSPNLMYTVPSFQNPSGISYPEKNRRKIASSDWEERSRSSVRRSDRKQCHRSRIRRPCRRSSIESSVFAY